MRAISFLAAIFLSSIAFAESTIYEFYRPTDNGKALINPDMGWCAYFYSCRTGNYGYFLEPDLPFWRGKLANCADRQLSIHSPYNKRGRGLGHTVGTDVSVDINSPHCARGGLDF